MSLDYSKFIEEGVKYDGNKLKRGRRGFIYEPSPKRFRNRAVRWHGKTKKLYF